MEFTQFSAPYQQLLNYLLEKVAEKLLSSFAIKDQNKRLQLLRTIGTLSHSTSLSERLHQ